MLKLNAFFSIVKLFLNIRLGGGECKYADQMTLFVSPYYFFLEKNRNLFGKFANFSKKFQEQIF